MQHLQHALTPTQLDRLHWLLFALIALGTLAQTRVCLYLAQLTSIAPNTWRQRLKRFRQQPFPEQTLFPALLRLVVEWLRLPQVFLALDATTLGNRWTVLALGVVVHHHTIPIAWRVLRGNTKGAWLPLCEAMLALLRGALPKSMPVYVLTDRGLWSPELFWGNRAQRVASADAHQRARQLSSVVGASGASVGGVVSCAGGSAGGDCWGGVSVSVAVYFGGVLGRGGAGCVVSVDGLACACGLWVVVWVSDVDRAGVSLAQAWVFWVASVSCGFGGGYGLGVVGVCVGMFIGGA
jgi:hypothetical protein